MKIRQHVCIALVAIGAMAAGSSLRGATVHFTTQEDFGPWTPGTAQMATATSPFDLDGSGTNGLGNLANAGGAGTAGSLAVTWQSGAFNYVFGPGEQGNAAFLAALGSGAGRQLQLDYTTPPPGTGDYFQLGIVLNYDGNFGQFFPVSTTDHGTYTTATYDYIVNPVALSYFQLGFIYNSNYNTNTPFYVDNIRVIPEPATLVLLGLGALGLVAVVLRRRRNSA